ncbi:MAG: hypothetical protein IPL06_23315 [Betaproteobacteria bacterium]|jgi:hypothetical protein|nr:hypothetical protein [Betaproteobacteria bacterium]
MDWIPGRAVIVALAIAGGALSALAIWLRHSGRGAGWVRRLDAASYLFMGVSMFFFIAAGLAGKTGA